jgi:HEAT repeat protein
MWYVREAGANTLSKLSQQSKIPIFLNLNVIDVLVAKFRESIRPAIPQIQALLNDPDPDVRKASADALSNFSRQGNISNFMI